MICYERFSLGKKRDARICAVFKLTNKTRLTAPMDWKINV